MAKKNAKREEQWAEAKRRCRLSAERLRRAKEMGLNPLNLIKNIPAPTQQWKLPVGEWIDEMYEKRQRKLAAKQAHRAEVIPHGIRAAGSGLPRGTASRERTKHVPSADPFDYHIQLKTEMPLSSREDESHLLKYAVTLLGDASDVDGVDGPRYARIGDLRVWRFLVGAHHDKGAFPLFDLFDADSDEAMQLYDALFDPESEDLNPSLVAEGFVGKFGVLGTDILHFQWGNLPSEYRRSNVSLAMVERTIDAIGGGCFAATLWPWDESVPSLDTASSAEVLSFFGSQQVNEDHWGKIGFRRIPGTLILVRDLIHPGWKVESLMEGIYGRDDALDSHPRPGSESGDVGEIPF